MVTIRQRLKHLLIALDQLGGVLISLGAQFPDETPSSYAYRLDKKGKFFGRLFRPFIDRLFLLVLHQEDHCHMAYLEERARYQLPPMLRDGAPDAASGKV